MKRFWRTEAAAAALATATAAAAALATAAAAGAAAAAALTRDVLMEHNIKTMPMTRAFQGALMAPKKKHFFFLSDVFFPMAENCVYGVRFCVE